MAGNLLIREVFTAYRAENDFVLGSRLELKTDKDSRSVYTDFGFGSRL
jgi:hypothetical protein